MSIHHIRILIRHNEYSLYEVDNCFYVTDSKRIAEIDEDYAMELQEISPDCMKWFDTYVEAELRNAK